MRNCQKKGKNIQTCAAVICVAVLLSSATVMGMPPHPDVADRIASGAVQAPIHVSNPAYKHDKSICSPDDDFFKRFLARRAEAAKAVGGYQSPAAGSFRLLAILVDFSDNTSSVAPAFFDSLVFSSSGSTVRTYYDEVSRNQIDMITIDNPSSTGWQRAPSNYAYYVDGQAGMGTYPQNSQGLVEDLVDMVDGALDFSPYDNDSDGLVDVLLVIHAGSGQEYSGSASDMWSHKWGLPSYKATNDGVSVFTYTVQPEYWQNPGDMTIGVYCHELGHGFGLPDLYDVDGSSQGIGRWCLMAGGSWNGSLGNSPSYFSAWCRVQMGIDTVINVDANRTNEIITPVETGGPIYRVWSLGTTGPEYFLLENRQLMNFDAALPGSGLLVWHVDENAPTYFGSNSYEWYPGQDSTQHFLVALEQADGLFELDKTSGGGVSASDASDPFPGALGVTAFSPLSAPNSTPYLEDSSDVAVTSIAVDGVNIQANLLVGILAAGTDPDDPGGLPRSIELAQNYPNPFNPTTVIEFTVSSASQVTVEVYNVLGQQVAVPYHAEVPAGTHRLTWDGLNGTGSEAASGIYFYRLTAGDATLVKKMALVR